MPIKTKFGKCLLHGIVPSQRREDASTSMHDPDQALRFETGLTALEK